MRRSLRILLLPCLLAAQPRVDHVVVVGVDGLGAEGVRRAAPPRLAALMRDGAFSLAARGILPTVSSPNWASMIMGAGPEQHGVTSNEWQPAKAEIPVVCASGPGGRFPTVFAQARRRWPSARIAVIHDWEGFGRLVEPEAASLLRHVKGSPAAMQAAIEEWRDHRPRLLFVHLDDVDHAGHDHGWYSDAYRDAVHRIDGLIGALEDAIRQSGAWNRTVLLITADHGGRDRKHGVPDREHLEIPWIAAGGPVARGKDLGAGVFTYDTAATVAWLLRAAMPDCWRGRPVRAAFR